MTLADMPKPPEAATEHRLHFHDGSSRTVYVIDREVPFPEGRLIISRVDLGGVMTLRSLREGLRYSLQVMGYRVVATGEEV